MEAKRIAEGDSDPGAYRINGPRELEIEEEMRALPSRDIAAELTKAAVQVAEVATRKLKGGFVKTLKEAVLQLKMGTDTLASRAHGALPPSEKERADEVTRLRQEVSDLRQEIARLWEDRRLMPHLPPAESRRCGTRHLPSGYGGGRGDPSLPSVIPPQKE